MGNLDAFKGITTSPRGEVDPFGVTLERAPILVLEDTGMVDADGIPVPPFWQQARRRWDTLALSTRRKFAEEAQYMRQSKPQPKERRPGTGATRFTTQYAIEYGRKQNWTLVDRENYDSRTKRHHDLQLGLDAIFDDGEGLVGIQGAGQSERKEHWDRFADRGGVEKAKRRHIRILYLEFVRGNKTPVKQEWWA